MTKKPEDCYTWLAYMQEEGIITHDEYNVICKRLDDRTLKDFWEVAKKYIKCEITGEKCIHADAQPDDGIYDNCRLCKVYEREYYNYLWEKNR